MGGAQAVDGIHASTECLKRESSRRSILCARTLTLVVLGVVSYFDTQVRACAGTLGALVLGGAITTCLPGLCGDERIKATWVGVCSVNMIFRTAAHLMVAAWHNDNLLFRLMSVFLLPILTVRQAHTIHSFKAYLLAHTGIVLWRISSDFEVEWPWLLITVASSMLFLHLVEDRIAQRALLAEVEEQKRQAGQVAEKMMKNMLETFCDATVTMASDTTIAESPPELEVLMSRKYLKDRRFAEFVEPADLDVFQQHMDDLLSEIQRDISEHPAGGGDQEHSWYLHSCRVRLVDSYAVHFEVNLYSVCMRSMNGKPTVLMGVNEIGRPTPKERKQSKSRHRKPIFKMNFETGVLEPIGTSFAAGDVEVVKGAGTLALERRLCQTHPRHREGSPLPRSPKLAAPPGRPNP